MAIWNESAPYEFDLARVAAFADAVQDGRQLQHGSPTPPTMAIVALWAVQDRALDSYGKVGNGLGLHGEQVFRFARPMRVGEGLLPRARVVRGEPNRRGSTLTVHGKLLDRTGALVVESLFVLFLVGRQIEAFGTPPEGLALPSGGTTHNGGSSTVERTVAADQPDRYAAASGDNYAIHLDDDAARAHGLPRRILHGMCTLGIACSALLENLADGDPTPLAFLGARFSDVVLPGDRLQTTYGSLPNSPATTFESRTTRGAALTRGRLELQRGRHV